MSLHVVSLIGNLYCNYKFPDSTAVATNLPLGPSFQLHVFNLIILRQPLYQHLKIEADVWDCIIAGFNFHTDVIDLSID